MRLTIKQKQHKEQQQSQSGTSSFMAVFHQYSPLPKIFGCGGSEKKKVVFRASNERERAFLEAIRIDVREHFRKVYQEYVGERKNKKEIAEETQGMYQFIYQVMQKLKCEYSTGLGFLCLHAYCHWSEEERYNIILEFMTKYAPILNNNQSHQSKLIQSSLSQQTLQRIMQYTSHQQNTRIQTNRIDMQSLQKKYQSTLLLEYIPPQYSSYIIGQLLTKGLEQYIKLVVSLIHYTIYVKNPINQQHLMNILLNAYMGVIEWPVVISNRHIFTVEGT